ncbi:hypothetical protein IFM62136_05451 [Aspergillus lentulus]|nr:hypothetical protein IFM62136_05451 [Aspergillus lentulus]
MESGSSSLIEAAPRETTAWPARTAYFPGPSWTTAVNEQECGDCGQKPFVRHRDSYVLPFSPENAPSEFQLYIERVLGHTLGDEVTAHIDNILIHSLDRAKFANHFQDHDLGLAYAAQPLQPWQWTSTTRTDPCEFTTNASLFAIGAILSQSSHVTTIISRSLTKEERNYDAAERELLGVVYALYCFTLVDAQQSQLQQAAFGSKPPLSPAMPRYSAALDICNLDRPAKHSPPSMSQQQIPRAHPREIQDSDVLAAIVSFVERNRQQIWQHTGRKGGWEGWLQAELANFIPQSSPYFVEREQAVYQDTS